MFDCFFSVRCQDHMIMHSRFLRGLVPVSSVRETVHSIEEQYFHDRYNDWMLL